jgi:hypothetical protein
MTCCDCGAADRTVMITSWVRIGKRVITWSQCRPCWAREEKLHA